MPKALPFDPPPVSGYIDGKMNSCTDTVDVMIEFKDAMQTIVDRTSDQYTKLFAQDWVKGLNYIINQELDG
jgi:predicted nucleic acid-binding Zn ribbon protein